MFEPGKQAGYGLGSDEIVPGRQFQVGNELFAAFIALIVGCPIGKEPRHKGQDVDQAGRRQNGPWHGYVEHLQLKTCRTPGLFGNEQVSRRADQRH